ncbi:hypothetical protein K435DRAFT_776472, partial [Dendrothele bispora CBS 962.96]
MYRPVALREEFKPGRNGRFLCGFRQACNYMPLDLDKLPSTFLLPNAHRILRLNPPRIHYGFVLPNREFLRRLAARHECLVSTVDDGTAGGGNSPGYDEIANALNRYLHFHKLIHPETTIRYQLVAVADQVNWTFSPEPFISLSDNYSFGTGHDEKGEALEAEAERGVKEENSDMVLMRPREKDVLVVLDFFDMLGTDRVGWYFDHEAKWGEM